MNSIDGFFYLFLWNIFILKSLWLWVRINMAPNSTPRWVNGKSWCIWMTFCCYCFLFICSSVCKALKNINRFLWFWSSSTKIFNRLLNRMGVGERLVNNSLKQNTKIMAPVFNRYCLSASKTLKLESCISVWIWAVCSSEKCNKKNQLPQV